MSEYERRRQGVHNGAFNSRKRRHREDNEYDRRPQRRRYDDPMHTRLRKRLLSVAEPHSRKHEHTIDEISKILVDGFEEADIRDTFTEITLHLTLEQPFKIPFLSAIIVVANNQNPRIAEEAIKLITTRLEYHIREGEWREVKLCLRLLAGLQGVLEGAGVFVVLDELFSRAVDLQTSSSEDGLGLELVKIILFTIAYAMASSATGLEDRAAALLEKTDIIASTPHILDQLVNPYPNTAKASLSEPKSTISLLQAQMQSEASKSWPLKSIPRPWKFSTRTDALAKSKKHALPVLSIPSQVVSVNIPRLPEMYFSVYGNQEIHTVPPEDDSASLIIRDSAIDTINVLDFNRNIAAKILIDLDCYFTPGIFVGRGLPYDKLRELEDDVQQWKPEDVAVDAVFSQLLQLPAPEHKLVYYHSVLTEACKIAPAAIAPSLGRAIRYLYKNIEYMDLELTFRFMDWFSHHLSNFGFTWKWIEWIGDVELSANHPKKSFVIGALEKETRLSFAQRIRGTLPEQYQPLLSDTKDQDNPDFKYNDDSEPYAQSARELLRLFRTKAPDLEIQEQILAVQDTAIERGITDPLVPSTEVLLTTLCYLGSKSLSHMLSYIERHKDRLLAIGSSSELARRQIISSVLEYWKEKPGIGVNIVDKLLNYTILTPMAVIEWICIDQLGTGQVLTHSHIFEMVSNTISKVSNRVRQIVYAKIQKSLAPEQLSMLNDTFDKERVQMKRLFAVLEDFLKGIAEGSADAMVENHEENPEEVTLLRHWGQEWLRVFRRKLAVEEAWVQETLSADGNFDGGLTSDGQSD